jgi:hypothetical protein
MLGSVALLIFLGGRLKKVRDFNNYLHPSKTKLRGVSSH